ncbi:MAG: amidohydrolase family protein, partial [Gemmatimonadota bacterium]|nr:amidohydrolase family protein [Gemmatimonadota bacterium]
KLKGPVGFYRPTDVISIFPAEGGPPTDLVVLGASGATAPARSGFWEGADRAQNPSFTPDGRTLFFGSAIFTGEERRIRRLDLTTGTIDDVTESTGRYLHCCGRPAYPLRLGEVGAEVSPDGRWLTFARKLPGGVMSYRGHEYMGRTALWIRDLETGDERILMDPITPAATDHHPSWNIGVLPGYSWAPDGRSLVITQGGRIRRVDVQTGDVETIPFRARVQRTISEMARASRRIADDDFAVRFARTPVTSPDGRHVVFEAAGWLWIEEVGEGSPRRLTDAGGYLTAAGSGGSTPTSAPAPMADPHPSDQPLETGPAWSHDGRWVAYTSWDDVDGGNVWKVPAQGGTPVRLTTTAGRYAHLAWHPGDGALVVNRWDPALNWVTFGGRGWQLVDVPADGGPARELTASGPQRDITIGEDGRLYFAGNDGGAPAILSLSADGGDRRAHLRLPPGTEQAALSPDGRHVAFRQLQSMHVAPAPPGLTATGPLTIDAAGPGVTRLHEGGIYPSWRDNRTLEYATAARHATVTIDGGEVSSSIRDLGLRIPRPRPTGTLALEGARIVTMADDDVIERGTIVIDGSRIACVGDCDTSGADRVVDVSGKTIIPGLLDVHAHHLTFAGNSFIPPQRRHESARYLVFGVTTTHDPSAQPDPSFVIAEMHEAGRVIGPRTYSTGQTLVCPPHGPVREIRSYEDARNHVNRLADQGALSLKDYKQCTRVQRQMLAQASLERGVTLTAENGDFIYLLGLVMGGHTGWEHPIQNVPTYGDVTTFMGQAGATYSPQITLTDYPKGVALEFWLGERDLWLDPLQLAWSPWQEIAARRSFVKKPAREYIFPLIAEGAADILRAGGHVAVGAHGEVDGLGAHWEMWALGEAMTPLEALKTGTISAARFIGLEQDIGSIEVGKLADLAVLDQNPLEDIRLSSEVSLVLVGGNLFDARTLRQTWPIERDYGPRPWTNEDITRTDVRADDYWDRRASG